MSTPNPSPLAATISTSPFPTSGSLRPATTKHSKSSSQGKLYPYLNSLQKLNNLKHNAKVHSLTYRELTQLPSSINPVKTPKKPKKLRMEILSAPKNDEFISFDPRIIQESLPKKREKVSLPSEKRQLLISSYQSHNETRRLQTSPKKLGSIWHQTLTTRCTVDDEILLEKGETAQNSPFKVTRRLTSPRVSRFSFPDTPELIRLRQKIDETGEMSQSKDFTKLETGETERRQPSRAENTYKIAMKEILAFGDLLKDFSKIASNTKKSYEKAEEQQTSLYNFVTVFVKEIDDLERIPKEPKISRLQVCVQTIEQKIDELCVEGDLLNEQIHHIQVLLATLNPSTQVPMVYPLRLQRPNRTSAPQTNIIDRNETPFSVDSKLLQSDHFESVSSYFPPTDEERYSSVPGALDLIRLKTQELKVDVQRLQTEKSKFFKDLEQNKRGCPRRKSQMVVDETPRSEINEKSPEGISEADLSLLAYRKSYEKGNLVKQSVLKLSMFPINEMSPIASTARGRLSNSDLILKEGQLSQEGRKEVGSSSPNDDRRNVENKPKKDDVWASTMILYEFYLNLLAQIETIIKQELDQMKAFQKDVDIEKDTEDKNNIIVKQIDFCFEQVLNEIFEYLGNMGQKRVKFFDEVLTHLIALDTINKSNSLKLKSFKNVVEASIQQLIQVDKYSKKYTRNDLTDKALRQKFETKYEALKSELLEYRKTLGFLAEHLNLPLSMYGLSPIDKISLSDFSAIKDRFQGIWKTLYYLNKVPQFEEEYNKKAGKAYAVSKSAKEMIDALQEFFMNSEVEIVPKLWKGEEITNALKTINVRILGLRNEFEAMSKVGMLSRFIEKPLLITVKLVKRVDMNEKSLDQLLKQIQEEITISYNKLIMQCEEVEKQVATHLKRFLATQEHLIFPEWRQNHQIMASLKTEINTLEGKLEEFNKRTYPSRVFLLPKPEHKKHEFVLLSKEIESVMTTLTAGRILGSDFFFSYFDNVKTSNLKEKLEKLLERVQQEHVQIEKVNEGLIEANTLPKKVVDDINRLLANLCFVFNETFKLQETITKEYLEFHEEHAEGEGYSQGATYVLDRHRDRYPKLMTAVSLEAVDKMTISQDSIEQSLHLDDHIEEHDINKKNRLSPIRTLPNINSTKKEYPKKMNGFIAKLKGLFSVFLEEKVGVNAMQHVLFREMLTRFQKMYYEELDMLERIQTAVHNVQVNHLFYNKEIRPLTKLHKCINLLEKWEHKVESLMTVKDWMINTFRIIKSFKGEENMRGGIETQVVKYLKTQEMVTTSVDIVIEILSLGSIINEKELKLHLGFHLRVEEASMEAFIKHIDVAFESIKIRYEANLALVEQDTCKLMEHLSEFLKALLGLLRLIQTKYKDLFKIISEGIKPHGNDFVKYMEAIYNAMNDLTDQFLANLNTLTNMTVKPTWVIKALDDFYKDIILKDLHLFAGLKENSKEVEDFLKEFREDFIEKDLKQRVLYKKIAESNPIKCDRRVVRVTKLAQALTYMTHTSEVLCRPELKQLLLAKNKTLQAVKKIYINFAMIYSMGKNLNDKMQPILANRDVNELGGMLMGVEIMVQDMIKHLYKSCEECRLLNKDNELEISFNFEKVLKDDILAFYVDFKAWLHQLRINLAEITGFYIDLKKNFRGEILLLRDDWVSFIKDWIANSFIDLSKNLKGVNPSYQEFKEKLDAFTQDVQKHVTTTQNYFKEIVENVQCLNNNFFLERFFNSEEGREVDDKISLAISKVTSQIKNDKCDPEELKEKFTDIIEIAQRCDKSIKYLSSNKMVTQLFESGVKSWDHVLDYYRVRNISTWVDLVVFSEAELTLSPDDDYKKARFKDKVQTVEGLYLYAEQWLKCQLNARQKDFLSVVYEWMKKNVYML